MQWLTQASTLFGSGPLLAACSSSNCSHAWMFKQDVQRSSNVDTIYHTRTWSNNNDKNSKDISLNCPSRVQLGISSLISSGAERAVACHSPTQHNLNLYAKEQPLGSNPTPSLWQILLPGFTYICHADSSPVLQQQFLPKMCIRCILL